MATRPLFIRAVLVLVTGAVLSLTRPHRVVAAEVGCGQCGTIDLCSADFCSAICGGVGEGAMCYEDTQCGSYPNVYVDCGFVS